LSFDFPTVRQLQKSCAIPPLPTPFTDDDPLRQQIDAAETDESALKILNEIIEKNEETASSDSAADDNNNINNNNLASDNNNNNNNFSAPDGRVLHKALLLRSEIYSKMGNFVRSKDDAQRAILSKPNYADPYGALSLIESKRSQFGRSEVALRLGLFVDPKNDRLTGMLAAIRAKDPVHQDVSHKRGTDRKVRREQNQAGYDLEGVLPDLISAIMDGNLDVLKMIWKPDLRDFRYGRIKNPLMHFPVLGAQRRCPVLANTESSREEAEQSADDYKSVVDFLFDQGVRLDARDVVGYTAVMHAAAHIPQPELLNHLLTKGADPNLRSCYGTVALMDATMNQNTTEIDILMRHGADPYIACNDGIVPLKMGEDFAHIIAVYDRHLKPSMPDKICVRCTGVGSKRCIKCRVVYYCSKPCQRDDWPSHKEKCKVLCKSHKRVAISAKKCDDIVSTSEYRSAMMKNFMSWHLPGYELKMSEPAKDLYKAYTDEWKKSGNLLLKIQAAKLNSRTNTHDSSPNPDSDLLAYNEARNFMCYLDPKKLDGPELFSVIKEKGVGTIKAYFWAYMEPGKQELIVITDPVHAAQPW